MDKEKLHRLMDKMKLTGENLSMIMSNNGDMCGADGMMLSSSKFVETANEIMEYVKKRITESNPTFDDWNSEEDKIWDQL